MIQCKRNYVWTLFDFANPTSLAKRILRSWLLKLKGTTHKAKHTSAEMPFIEDAGEEYSMCIVWSLLQSQQNETIEILNLIDRMR